MRIILAALMLAALGCDDDADGGSEDLAVADMASGAVAIRTAMLTGGQEAPAVASTYTGSSTLTVDATRTTITVVTTQTIPPGNTTMAHIHVGAATVSGPVIFNLVTVSPVPASFTKSLTATDLVLQSTAGVNNFDDAVEKILAGQTYINIHTMAFPNGEIRGQYVE